MTTEQIPKPAKLSMNPKFWIPIASAILFLLLVLLVFMVLIPEIKAARAAARNVSVKSNLRHGVGAIAAPEITFHTNGTAESTFWYSGMHYPEFESFAFVNDSGSVISKEEIPEFVLQELEKEFEKQNKSNNPLVNLHMKFGPSDEEVLNESTDSFWENYQELIPNETTEAEESGKSEK